MIWGRSDRIQAGGATLEIATFGPPPGEAPTLVMLHEGLGCVALWRDWPERLAALTGCGVLVYSRAGYGQSDPDPLPWPVDYLSRHALSVLPEVLAPLREIILLGHSDGGTIAAVYASSVSDARLKGAVLIAPHFFAEADGLAAIKAARVAYEDGDLRRRLAPYHADVDCAFDGWSGCWLHPDFRTWSIKDVLPKVSVPVLTIQGDADPYGTLAQVDAVTQACPMAEPALVLPGVRHAPHQEAREAVEARLLAFVQKVLKHPL